MITAEQRIDDLIAQMTPEEKTAQLHGIWLKDLLDENGRISIQACETLIPHGIGQICQYSSATNLKPDELVRAVRDLQRFLREKTRLGIPAACQEEAITGLAARGAATYPQQINMSCTWNPEMLLGNTQMTARIMKMAGAAHALSPMLDVLDNAQWGRSEEGFGEDPYLVSLMGLTFIQGLQGADLRDGIAATAKHFAGYGNMNQDMGVFWDDVLMPHEVAVRFGRVAAIMSGYHAFQGVPTSASKFLLHEILREKWGFDGAVISDYGAVRQVNSVFNYTPDATTAALRCLEAGLDLELPKLEIFSEIPKAMADGVISTHLVDRAVKRALTFKARTGVLDLAEGPASAESLDFNPPESQRRAYQSACESLVLLQNDGVLPLEPGIRSVAVVGPNADSPYSLLGDYTYQTLSEFFRRTPINPREPRLVTLLAGLRERLRPEVKITHERGCDWAGPLEKICLVDDELGDERTRGTQRLPLEAPVATDPHRAVQIAAESDLIIAAMGENRYLCGEGCDREDVRLPGEQEAFVKRLLATGKPVVLVVFGGRPMVLADLAAGCRAIVYAWYPGQAGGHALADLLLGRFNPSGKLTMTLPRSNEQVPVSHRLGYRPDDLPLFPFGHGLSYTAYGYANMAAPKTLTTSDTSFPVQFELTNTGNREGVEIAQLYFVPLRREAHRPAMEIKGFARVALKPGETRKVTIDVFLHQLARHDAAGQLTLRPGAYSVLIGASSTDIRLRTELTLTGDTVALARREHFFSQTRVE